MLAAILYSVSAIRTMDSTYRYADGTMTICQRNMVISGKVLEGKSYWSRDSNP